MKNNNGAYLRQNTFRAVCLNSCRNLLAKIDVIKQRVYRQFTAETLVNERVLKGALNEAEALAWQTPFPHLFFPELAKEKAVEARRWTEHQRELQRSGFSMAFAA